MDDKILLRLLRVEARQLIGSLSEFIEERINDTYARDNHSGRKWSCDECESWPFGDSKQRQEAWENRSHDCLGYQVDIILNELAKLPSIEELF